MEQNFLEEPGSDNRMVSRRKWFGQVSIPAVAMVGAGLLGPLNASAGTLRKADENLYNATVFNIKDFGAKGDGKTLDTTAVQKAIDTCAKGNGGIVFVPAGDFIIGTLELKSNVTLHLSAKGRLLGSSNRADYRTGEGVPPGNGNMVLLYAVNASNISIEGKGSLDGDGINFYTGQGDNTGPNSTTRGYMDRPHLVIFYKCNNILLRDVFFTRSAYHCFRILECKQVNIDGVRIYNRVNKNNDGFHFNSCEYVHITNCDVKCQDDACALFGSNKFITVSNCTFSTRWSIFRFGSGQSQYITVSNCIIYDTYGCPVKISAGKAQIENLIFSNIIMQNVTGPIGIGFSGLNKAGSAGTSAIAEKSFVRNITFSNIRATVVKQPVNHPDIAFDVKPFDGEQYSCITLNGIGDNFLENISFTDIQIAYIGGGTSEMAAKRHIPSVVSEYFGVWAEAPAGPPAYGIYARNVKGLTLQNVKFTFENPDLRPAAVFDNLYDVSISNMSIQGTLQTESLLRVTNSSDMYIQGCRVLSPSAVFLRLEGAGNQNILVDGGDLGKAGKVLELINGAKKENIKLKI